MYLKFVRSACCQVKSVVFCSLSEIRVQFAPSYLFNDYFSSERGHSEESQNSSREPSHGQAEGREGRQVEEAGSQGPNDR